MIRKGYFGWPGNFRGIAIGAIALALAAFYYFFNPLETSWMPQCVFHHLTGLQCMGCGSQRAVHALFHGDFAGAWKANMLMVIAMPFLIFLLALELKRKRYPALYARVHSVGVIIAVSVILLAWFFLRNIFDL